MDGTASHGRFCDPEQTHRVRVQPSAQSLQEFTMATPAPTQPGVKSGRPLFFFFSPLLLPTIVESMRQNDEPEGWDFKIKAWF